MAINWYQKYQKICILHNTLAYCKAFPHARRPLIPRYGPPVGYAYITRFLCGTLARYAKSNIAGLLPDPAALTAAGNDVLRSV